MAGRTSLAMIVKNEAEHLDRCLTSVAHLVNEMVVVDTGSSDGTKELLTEKVEREARIQLANYLTTDDAKRIPNLKAWLIILVGREWQVVEEIFPNI